MARRRAVPSLLSCALASLQQLVERQVVEGCSQADRLDRATVERAVAALRCRIFQCVAHTLHQPAVSAVLAGLELSAAALKVVMSNGVTSNSKALVAAVSFTDLFLTDRLLALDLTTVSKMLRNNIYDKLGKCRNLRTLNLGSGSGGWSNMYIDRFVSGVKVMKHLVKFSLCYDCTDSVLKV